MLPRVAAADYRRRCARGRYAKSVGLALGACTGFSAYRAVDLPFVDKPNSNGVG